MSILLQALEAATKEVDYYALDLSLKELKRTLSYLPTFKHVKCHGLHGTYDDGLDWLKMSAHTSRPRVVMSLGSSIGQFIQAPKPIMTLKYSQGIFIAMRLLISCAGFQQARI